MKSSNNVCYDTTIADAVWVKIHHDEPEVPEELLNLLKEAITVKPEPVKSAHKGTRLIDVVT